MSLNSVVNNLVRAAAGIPADITDPDLDKHVAELLAREAKERDAKWSEIGLGGLLGNDRSTPDPNAPKPNKRFLASIIRTVDTHNSSVIRQQLEAAETARSAAGLGESSRSAASRMFGGAMRDASQSAHSRRGRSDRDRAEREREQRWHDKRQGSRERRTRYDVGEEEEMFNAGVESLPESKGSRDWMKRKSEKDARRRREESSDDEESRRRRRDLYGDEEEDGRSTRRRRRSPDHETKGKDRERDRPREDRADRNERYGEKASSRRNERRNSDGEHDGENRRDRRRRLRAEREAAGEGGIDHEEKGGADATSRPHRTEALQDDVERDPSSRRETSPGQKRLEKEYVSTRKRDRDQDGLSRSEPHRREADDKAKRGRHARDSASPNRQVDQDRKARRHRDDEQEHRSRRHDNPSPRPTEARDTERKRTRDRSSEAVKEKEKNIKASSSSRPTRLPSTSPPPSRLRSSPSPAARRPAISPSPGPPPPDDLIPPPPDTPPPPPPPAPSKMDKYFQTDYDPRLDLGEVPRNGYVPEVGWDNMLAILKERGKKPRNRSPGLYDDPMEIPKIHLRRSPSPTLKEIEKAERRAKRAQRGFDDDFETEAERSKRKAERKKEKEERARVTQLGPGDGGGLLEVTYVKKGGVREWDMGK